MGRGESLLIGRAARKSGEVEVRYEFEPPPAREEAIRALLIGDDHSLPISNKRLQELRRELNKQLSKRPSTPKAVKEDITFVLILEELYPVGTKVYILQDIEDELDPLPAGTRGKIKRYDDVGNAVVEWENSSRLMLLTQEYECVFMRKARG